MSLSHGQVLGIMVQEGTWLNVVQKILSSMAASLILIVCPWFS